MPENGRGADPCLHDGIGDGDEMPRLVIGATGCVTRRVHRGFDDGTIDPSVAELSHGATTHEFVGKGTGARRHLGPGDGKEVERPMREIVRRESFQCAI